jgi:hypothetical protein
MGIQWEDRVIKQELADEQFSSNRYESHIVAKLGESVASYNGVGEVLIEGVTICDLPTLAAVKQEALVSDIQ